ncbi:MAG: hypothetical protein OHK0035_22890 [Cyanobacteria bacterium J069]
MHKAGALTQALTVAIEPKQQNVPGILRIGKAAHPAECTRSIVERVGRNRNVGLSKRNELVSEVRDRQEIVHS